MNKLKYFLLLTTLLLLATPGFSQAEMADTMRSNGKIYVVVGIITIVLFGLLVYIFVLDRKVSRLENLLREKHQQTK